MCNSCPGAQICGLPVAMAPSCPGLTSRIPERIREKDTSQPNADQTNWSDFKISSAQRWNILNRPLKCRLSLLFSSSYYASTLSCSFLPAHFPLFFHFLPLHVPHRVSDRAHPLLSENSWRPMPQNDTKLRSQRPYTSPQCTTGSKSPGTPVGHLPLPCAIWSLKLVHRIEELCGAIETPKGFKCTFRYQLH